MADYVNYKRSYYKSGIFPPALPPWSRARFRNTVWLEWSGGLVTDQGSKCTNDGFMLISFVILIF